ncbi:MAG: linear amide C-N hydrolase, partial [Eubacterium sp.]|nr:linear amide C-N hydrolase [Eubacterium sp.]
KEACNLVEKINLLNTPFNDKLPVAQLHWIISDSEESVTVEAVKEGIKVYDNPIGVLTNNPPFDMQMFALNNYMSLSVKSPNNTFAKDLNLKQYSRGMGGIGLPGDLSSQSRFVRVAFIKMNSISGDGEKESVSQFFHILNSVDQQRGCCDLGDGKYEISIYTSCCNTNKGIYYYRTYDNHQITAVDMNRENLNDDKLIRYSLITEEQIRILN